MMAQSSTFPWRSLTYCTVLWDELQLDAVREDEAGLKRAGRLWHASSSRETVLKCAFDGSLG